MCLCLCLYLPGSFLIINQKSFLLSRINNDYLASWLATMGCVLLIFGRLVSGWLFDKFRIIGLLRIFIFIILLGHIIIIT
jgi:MFS family permease